MAGNANIEDLLQYKKAVLRDDRRDSRIRDSIERTLDYLSRNSTKTNSFVNAPEVPQQQYTQQYTQPSQQYPPAAGPAPLYRPPQMAYPYITPPIGLGGTMGGGGMNDMAGRFNDDKKDLEKLYVQSEKADGGGAHGGGGHGHGHHDVDPATVDWRERLKHFTFAWYASTMSTGGVAFVLSVVPHRFSFFTGLGTAIYIFNIIYFLVITSIMITRFMMHPGTLTKALANPHEGFFFATFWLTIATMITNATAYGVPATGTSLVVPLRIAFWTYMMCAMTLALVHYHVIFTVKKLVITNVLPGWVLPIFPAMLVGTLASAIAKTQPPEHALPMLVAGLSFQGLGMILSIGMYGIYFGRLMTSGLPADMSRPAMFIAVGPPSFTALAFIGMAQDVKEQQIFTTYTSLPGITDMNMIYDLLQILALLSAIFLWVLSLWFFGIAVIASFEAIHRNDFHLNWYAYVFPNVGFTIATIKIGERLASTSIQIVGTGMGGILFFLWILIAGAHIKAFKNRMICWPGKDEDAH
jgi:C4-dicarboxylate transporter/malic acid transport protein